MKTLKELFNGGLGAFNTSPVGLELNDDTNAVCFCPHTVPKLHEGMFKKEVKLLVSLGILEHANDSKWGITLFF